MSQYGELITETFGNVRQIAAEQAVSQIDADPEAAARSIQLSQATDVPASVINGDLPTFERNHKAQLAGDIIRSNQFISDYIAQQPMASQLSNDDYGQLDVVSQSLQKTFGGTLTRKASEPFIVAGSVLEGAFKGFAHGAGPGGLNTWPAKVDNETLAQFLHIVTKTPFGAPFTATEAFFRGLGGILGGIQGGAAAGVEEFAKQSGASPSTAARMGREAGSLLQWKFDQPMHLRMPVHPDLPGQMAVREHMRQQVSPEAMRQIGDAVETLRPWLVKGEEPPVGVHPLIDQIKHEQATLDISSLDEQFREAQRSMTRERSPEIFAQFARQHTEAKIGISPEAIAELYKDKIPLADDGILGWVPDIQRQLESARVTGVDVEVPLADWLAKVDPEVAKRLREHIRVRPGGVTLDEATRLKPMSLLEQTMPAQQTEFLGEPLPKQSLAPANLYKDGSVVVGRPGQVHHEVFDRRYVGTEDTRYDHITEAGFVTPDGRFLNREQAYNWVKQNEGGLKNDSDGRTLDAADYNKQVDMRGVGILRSIRESASLEPTFAIGDRKLTLKRMQDPDTPTAIAQSAAEIGMKLHDFDIMNNKGERVAFVNLAESADGKTISIDYVQGLTKGQGGDLASANSLGPAQMRDILRQIKQEFPNAETLEGYRVSGARSRAETFETHGEVSIKLSGDAVIGDIEKFFANLTEGEWFRYGAQTEALIKPKELYTANEAKLVEAVEAEIKRIAPRVEVQEAHSVKVGQTDAAGVHIMYSERLPIILWALDASDPVGTIRHEAIHHLRQQGFFTEGEWATIREAALKGKWLEEFEVNKRWAERKLRYDEKLEEAVAEKFRTWMGARETDSAIGKVFQKIADFIDAIKAKFREILGKDPTWEDLFAKADSGEIGSRAGNEPLLREAYRESAMIDHAFEMDRAEQEAIVKRAANDPDAVRRKDKYVDYNDARADQVIQGLVDRGAIVKPFDAWRKIAVDEGLLTRGFPNAATAARKYSERGTPTIVIGTTGRRYAFADGREVARDTIGTIAEQMMPKEPELPGVTRMEDRRPFEQGAMPVAMPEANYRRYMKAIAERRAEDAAAAQAKAEAEVRRQQSAEWREAEPEARAQAVLNVRERPDIATDRFFRESILYDQKLTERPKLNPEFLTEEQRAKLPKDLLSEKGLHPDDVAGLFGYETGAAMVDHLLALQEVRGKTRPSDFNRKLIAAETQRLLKAKFGDLEENVLREARDHVTSETQLEILHEEVLALGLRNNAEFPITKEQMKQWTQQKFAELPHADVSVEKYLAASGRLGRAVEDALLKEDFAEAFRLKQQQYMAMQHALEAKKFEREREQFERTAKRFGQREVSGVDTEFIDFVQKMLVEAGVPVKRSLSEIVESIDKNGYTTLEGFVKAKKDDGWEPAVSLDPPVPLDQMTVQQFRDFKNGVDSLSHIGRLVNKLTIAGEKADFAEFRAAVIENIKTLPLRSEHRNWLYMFDASLTRMEEIVKDLDLRQQLGPLWNSVIRPMIDAKHTEYQMFEELTAKMVDFNKNSKPWRKTLNDTIPNNWFIDPRTDTPFALNRESMINMMLNFGNRSNIDKFTKGWFGKEGMAAGEARLRRMFDEHATADDWKYVQHIWDQFEGWRKKSDDMYHQLSGVAPKWIEPVPIDTPHGQFKGGYYPIIYDKLRSDIDVIAEKSTNDSMFGPNYGRATPSAHYTTERTGFAAPISFEGTTEQVGARMQQVMHDIAYRPALMQAAQVLNDRGIRAAINNNYGVEYGAQIKPWLNDIAGQFNMSEIAQQGINAILKRSRIALIGNVLPLNLRVIFSPSVGVLNPVEFAKTHANHSQWLDIATEKSREITHTFRNMDRDFREQMEQSLRTGQITKVQSDALKWAYSPVVWVEQQFRLATWVGQYKEGLAKGLSEGDAAAHADSIVRERHTSAGVADLSSVMRSNEAMKALTVFYGWFNTQYNWMRQMPGQARRGEWADLSKTAYGTIIIAAAFNYALFQKDKESDPWYKSAAKSLITVPFSNIPFGRDAANYFAEGYRPGTPFGSMIQYAGSVLSDVNKYRQGKRVEKPITHAANLIGGTVGMVTGVGLPLAQLGRTTQFGVDVYNNRQRPRNFTEWLRGIVTGEARLKP